jgi:methionyl-tRNA formyltransferase
LVCKSGLDTGGNQVEQRVAITDVIDAGKLMTELANLAFCDDGSLVATNDFILGVEQCQLEGKTMKAAQDWSALLNTTTMLTD